MCRCLVSRTAPTPLASGVSGLEEPSESSMDATHLGTCHLPAPPNYPLRDRKYHLTETIRPLVEVHWGVLVVLDLNMSPSLKHFKAFLYNLRAARTRQQGCVGLGLGCRDRLDAILQDQRNHKIGAIYHMQLQHQYGPLTLEGPLCASFGAFVVLTPASL